jgi:hypothetical protein
VAVEEVVLSVPGDPNGCEDPASGISPSGTTDGLERVVREYFKSARARGGLALSDRMRQRRHERFDIALKTLVKTMATEASRPVAERPLRLDVRTQVYAYMMTLVRIMARDHLIVIRRARRTLRWGLAFATVGAVGFLYTLIANGWLSIGWLSEIANISDL